MMVCGKLATHRISNQQAILVLTNAQGYIPIVPETNQIRAYFAKMQIGKSTGVVGEIKKEDDFSFLLVSKIYQK